MLRRTVRRSLARSALLSLVAHLATVAAAAAVTGGADWPLR